MSFSIASSYSRIRNIVDSAANDALPQTSSIEKATASLPSSLPKRGLGEAAIEKHLLEDITPGFNGPKTSANYYGFVTGGVLPIAEVADNIVTAFDQNVQVHLPEQSISTTVEDRALGMLVELLNLGDGWTGRTFTTGATGANILGLACGREFVIKKRLEKLGVPGGVGELGLIAAAFKAGVQDIQVLSSMGHSSIYKSASIVGLGVASVKDIGRSKEEPWKLDLQSMEEELQKEKDGIASIVVISAGEVNTGRFAADGLFQMTKIRSLCDKYEAWLHVDGAFGIFARSLPQRPEFASLIASAAGLELADSITGDGHKMLNVPYDCGFFLSKDLPLLTSVCQNPNAAYLSSGISNIPSPLNVGLENSRRFRALPVYAALLAYGREGYAEIFARQVTLARALSKFLAVHEGYELLAQGSTDVRKIAFEDIHVIVIFRARDPMINEDLVKRINATRKMYVSGTKWEGKPASRIAISTWKVDVLRDLRLVSEVLEDVLR